MTCFNDDIAIGVTIDFENVDLESRFQMWGLYLWLCNYRVFARMVCTKQGDENDLNLPISYHPYYTQQSFQVGKRKLDVLLSLGKHLTCKHIEQIKENGTILKDGASVIAYGLEEVKQEEVIGRLRKKKIVRDAGCYDRILPTSKKSMKNLSDFLDSEEVFLSPHLLAEAVNYTSAAQPQTLTAKPYIVIYAAEISSDIYSEIEKLAASLDWDLVVSDKLQTGENVIRFSDKMLDEFYGVLADAKYVVTDSAVVAGLALEHSQPLGILPNPNGRMRRLIHTYKLDKCTEGIPQDQKQIRTLKKVARTAALKMLQKRLRACRVLEDLLGLTKITACPVDIRMADCYGCYACKERCEKGAITMIRDKEGFYYPYVNPELCDECKECRDICIAREKTQRVKERRTEAEKEQFPIARIASCISEEQLAQSTSGGVFRSLVRYTIEKKQGVVCGACYDANARVVSGFAETMEDALRFSGSKYVMREISGLFPKVKEYLEAGRTLLFSGVPCECAGLLAYLGKQYENLILCEIICHGGASPKIYEKYIDYINKAKGSKVKKIIFRDKKISWLQKDYKLTFEFTNRKALSVRGRVNNYMNAYNNNYIFRMSCYRCQYAGNHRVGDITIGDYHGDRKIAGELYNEKGMSIVITNTAKGEQVWKEVQEEFSWIETTAERAYSKNHIRPSAFREERIEIMRKLDKEPINDLLGSYNKRKASTKA